MYFEIGNQIRAARALLGWSRDELADAAGLHCRAVAYWETKGTLPDYESPGLVMIREALCEAGVVATTDPAPGVRFLRKPEIVEKAQLSRSSPQNLGLATSR